MTNICRIQKHYYLYINIVSFTDGVIFWQKDQTPLYQGDVAFKKRENIEKLENGTLKVTLASDNDFGNYFCQFLISASEQTSVNHTVVKLSPPEIISLLPENNQTVVSMFFFFNIYFDGMNITSMD